MNELLFKIRDMDLKVPFKKQVKVEYSLTTPYAKPVGSQSRGRIGGQKRKDRIDRKGKKAHGTKKG